MKHQQPFSSAFHALLAAGFAVFVAASHAQTRDANAGKLLYTTPLALPNTFTCASGACHRANPSSLQNQNNIFRGADSPGVIANAIDTKVQMAFLQGKLNFSQLGDLAAYIANSATTGGAPSVLLSPVSLAFASTLVGSVSASQPFIIDSTGTAPLIVSSVSSSHPEFVLTHSCATMVAGTGCNVSVSFAPKAVGNRSGTVTVNHNATGGSSTVTVSGLATAPIVLTPSISVSPTALDFGAVMVGNFADALPVIVTSAGTAPLVITSLSDLGPNFALVAGNCAVGAQMAVNASCTLVLRFSPTAEGAQSGVLNIGSNASPAPIGTATAVSLTGTGATPPPSNIKTMVEYRYEPLNYFFVTSREADKLILDAIPDFRRTGQSFPVLASEVPTAKSIARFYFDKVAVAGSRGSHFYTLLDDEKNQLNALNPTNAAIPRLPLNEGVDSWAYLPLVTGPTGFCATGLTPVYRLFRGNVRFPDDPNHRFTVSTSLYNEYVALGWDGEGVRLCVPSQ